MFHLSKKNKAVIAILSLLLVVMSCGWYVWSCYHMTQERWMRAKATVDVCCHYELRAGNKILLDLGNDTTQLDAFFVNQYDLLPSCKGLLLAEDNAAIRYKRYQGMTPQQVYHAQIDSLQTIYKNAKWTLHEIDYYTHSHNVRDEGYGMIADYAEQQKVRFEKAKKLLDSLHHTVDTTSLRIVRQLSYKVLYIGQLSTRQLSSQACQLEKNDMQKGMNYFRLSSQALPDSACAINQRSAFYGIKMDVVPFCQSFVKVMQADSAGIYTGERDSLFHPHGHGTWMGNDGSHYEGQWKHGHRDGFGFGIEFGKQLCVGEWKNDRYRGERLVYTYDRIYGIDISKYQHIIGKKKYPIQWSKLRITNLGNISRKTVSGSISYPISFIYIKCTEGASLLNPYYRKDYRAAKAHGFRVGSYHFFSPRKPGLAQARKFMKHALVRRGDFPPVLDLEPTPRQIKQMGGPNAMFAQVRAWLRYVERQTGTRPILYISQMFVNRYLKYAPDLKRNYRVWIARYGEYKPDIRLVLWQLCPDGRVSGIRGHVDINVFNGYRDAYQKFLQNEVVK